MDRQIKQKDETAVKKGAAEELEQWKAERLARFTGGPREAVKAGMMFYDSPDTLTPEQIDPLLWQVVSTINGSGWVWTAESCQGHPDAASLADTGWMHNTHPMLRLVCREADLGRMMDALMRASLSRNVVDLLGVSVLRVIPQRIESGWAETIVYVEAHNVYERNRGVRLWERFADRLAIADGEKRI